MVAADARPPGDQDARDPDPGAVTHHQQIARNLACDIADIEDRVRQPEGRRGQRQIPVHRKRGKADIDAVELVEDVEHEQKWDQAQPYFPDRRHPLGLNGRAISD